MAVTTDTSAAATTIRPFTPEFGQADIDELRRRLETTRWPEQETVADESQGVQLATMQKLARYWATDHDWRKIETRLNRLPQFVTRIDGVDIHFIHVRSQHAGDRVERQLRRGVITGGEARSDAEQPEQGHVLRLGE